MSVSTMNPYVPDVVKYGKISSIQPSKLLEDQGSSTLNLFLTEMLVNKLTVAHGFSLANTEQANV